MRFHPFRPWLELLETRTTPAAWSDPQHLTLSLLPDGTDVLGRPSRLFDLLGPDENAWRRELLRAFQTWAVHATLDIGLVDDLGVAAGASGLPQSDPRFGDIRIGALPMSPDALAVASLPELLGGTWSGDVFLNTTAPFASGSPDLFSVLLHEAGHTLGLEHSEDPASVLTHSYSGPRDGLGESDIIRLQALYGPRLPDTWEGLTGNDTLAQSAALAPGVSGSPSALSLRADITSPGDVDYYRVQIPGSTSGFRVTLQTAGSSLLAGQMAIYDDEGRELGAASSGGDPGVDLVLELSDVRSRALYVRVAGDSADVFGLGGYGLSVRLGSDSDNPTDAGHTPEEPLPPASQPPALLSSSDRLRAVRLTPPQATPDGRSYRVRAEFPAGQEARALYVVKASPTASADASQTLSVTLRALDWPAWQPRVAVYDIHGRLIPTEILVHGDGTATVQLDGVETERDYYLLLEGEHGAYFLGVTFGLPLTELETLAAGRTVEAAEPVALVLDRNTLLHLLLQTDLPPDGADSAVRLTILSAAGESVYVLKASEAHSGQVFLPAGIYALLIEGVGEAGGRNYWLGAAGMSDPIGPEIEDPLGGPSEGGDIGETTDTTTSDPPVLTSPNFLSPGDILVLPVWQTLGSGTLAVAEEPATSTTTVTALVDDAEIEPLVASPAATNPPMFPASEPSLPTLVEVGSGETADTPGPDSVPGLWKCHVALQRRAIHAFLIADILQTLSPERAADLEIFMPSS